MKTLIKVAGLVLGWLFIIFLIGEVTLRALDPFIGVYYNQKDLGIRVKPFRFGANSQGFNDQEHSATKKPGVKRIVAIGDSFNWIPQEDREHNYWTLTQKILDEKLGNKIEILNQGTPATGPAYYFKLLETTSIYSQPDAVIVGFFVGNDFWGNEPNILGINRCGYPLNINLNDKRKFVPKRDSYLYFFVTAIYKNIQDQWVKFREASQNTSGWSYSEKSFLRIECDRFESTEYSFYQTAPWNLTKESLWKMKNYLDQKNIPMMVVLIPDEFQVNNDLKEKILKNLMLKPETYDIELPQKKLKEFMDAHNIKYLDLLPAMRKTALESSPYAFQESHFNRQGNAVAAQEVANFIENQFA